MTYRVMWSREMSENETQAFSSWATEQYEWMYRWAEARERVRAQEHAGRVQALRAGSQLRADRELGNEDVTAVEGSQKGRAA